MNKIFLFLACLVSALSQAQVYDFPIKPGTEEWGKLVTEADRFEAMQIPEGQLKSMSTSDLITTCMNFPAMGYFTAFNNPQDGMNVIIRNFNGLQELMKRNDAPTELLSVYKQMDSKTMKLQNQNIDQSSWSIKRCYFELLLTQDPIIEKMNKEERSNLEGEARKRLNFKIDNPDEYSSMDWEPTLKILNKIGDKSLDKSSRSTTDDLLSQFTAGRSSKAIASSDNPVYATYIIHTPKGTAVTAKKLVSGDYSDWDKAEAARYWLNYYNNRITYAGEATHAYNCHAYAWYCSEGNSYVWINSPGDDAFWNDNSYVLTNTPDENCKISFVLDDHSAITTSQSGYLKSKWGPSPLFIHSINDCPYNSTSLRYYRYPEVNYNTVPNKPFTETFKISGYGTFSASVSNDARYNVDLYEWKADYPSDWYIYPLNSTKSNVSIQRSSTPRSCYVHARAHNSYGWGEWQSIGWVYASSSYSLSVTQNSVNSTLNVQIEPASEMPEAIAGKTTYSSTNQTYNVGLYSSDTGICVYQSTVNNKDNNRLELNIDVSRLPNGVYILHVKNTQVNESPQTFKIIVKH